MFFLYYVWLNGKVEKVVNMVKWIFKKVVFDYKDFYFVLFDWSNILIEGFDFLLV